MTRAIPPGRMLVDVGLHRPFGCAVKHRELSGDIPGMGGMQAMPHRCPPHRLAFEA